MKLEIGRLYKSKVFSNSNPNLLVDFDDSKVVLKDLVNGICYKRQKEYFLTNWEEAHINFKNLNSKSLYDCFIAPPEISINKNKE